MRLLFALLPLLLAPAVHADYNPAWMYNPNQLSTPGSNQTPGTGTPLTGCVEGRALRIVNGAPSCASTAPPTLTACTGGTIDSTSTDFIGQVTLPAGLTSCTLVMTKLYATNFICVAQAQGGVTLTLSSPNVGNNGTYSTVVFPFGLSLTGAKFGYICGPG